MPINKSTDSHKEDRDRKPKGKVAMTSDHDATASARTRVGMTSDQGRMWQFACSARANPIWAWWIGCAPSTHTLVWLT